MRLLVINYAMDDAAPALAWQARVVRELARHCAQVWVLAERLGPCPLPENVRVEPLENGRLARLRQAWRVCRQGQVQAVFLHMAHRYAYRLWPVFRALRLPVLLWYAHGAVNWHLRLAHACVDGVVSSSPEGFRLNSRKVCYIGQGVDTDLFNLRGGGERRDLITVGRLTRRKRLDLLLEVLEHLRGDGRRLRVVGAALTDDDQHYAAALRRQAEARSLPVDFVGPVPLTALPACYDTAALHLNVSQTNSMDKTVLEALACGCPVLTSNPAFRELLAAYPGLLIDDERPEAIARQVRQALAHPAQPEALRGLVVGRHDLPGYTGRVLEQLHALATR